MCVSGCAQAAPESASSDRSTTEERHTEPGVCAPAPSLSSKRLSLSGTDFIDAAGRVVVLRGANTGGRNKFAPFMPFPFSESGLDNQLDAPDFDTAMLQYITQLSSWGINVIRLPFSWEALEPERGSYDPVYLERYLALVDAAGERGMRVIVDFHQDVFAAVFCGDGFPPWAVLNRDVPPPDGCMNWFLNYLQPGPMHDAFDDFWANRGGLMDAFEAMWQHMAQAAWGHDAVIGFEIINEPAPGHQDEAAWAAEELPAFYERMADVIHEVAPNALIFFDATGLDAVDQETDMRRPEGAQMVFAPHFYDPTAFMGIGTPETFIADEGLGRWAALGAEWDLPVFVGEFGMKPAEPYVVEYLDSVYDALDTHLLHGAVWEVSTTKDDWNEEAMSILGPGGVETVSVGSVVRPFPSSVAGELISFTWDRGAVAGRLTWDAEAGGVTEIVLPRRLGVAEWTVELSSAEGCVRVEPEVGMLTVQTTVAGLSTLDFRQNEP